MPSLATTRSRRAIPQPRGDLLECRLSCTCGLRVRRIPYGYKGFCADIIILLLFPSFRRALFGRRSLAKIDVRVARSRNERLPPSGFVATPTMRLLKRIRLKGINYECRIYLGRSVQGRPRRDRRWQVANESPSSRGSHRQPTS